ncbi:MAG: class I SAM-dependent methyltransferase [Candidatus Bathyarchaeia archaeon]|jgi:ubiquinone/menaquinone biosynthesis C-methylase UbiE
MMWTITNSKSLEDAIFNLKLKLAREIGAKRGMTVVDVGCGQGGFTASVARAVGASGQVTAVDDSDEHLEEFRARLDRYKVKEKVTLVKKDAADLKGVISNGVADMVVSYRLLEELRHPENMAKIVKEMARIVKKDGKVCLTELSTKARNKAEEIYIRLHKESGDCFFRPDEIVEAMKNAKLTKIQTKIVDTNIWFSPEVAKQDLGFAQVWFDEAVERSLGLLIERYGMKYPALQTFSGIKV